MRCARTSSKTFATDPRFVAVPELDAREPSTSFNVRGRDLRVDLLTPGSRESARPVLLPHLNAAALPLPGLEYLLTGATQAVVISGTGVLVNVPSPARFAVHKLWVAQRRNVSEHAKARKDIRQAGQILEVLLEDRRNDVDEAFGALTPSMVRLVRRSCATLDDSLRKRLP
ncbi:MAG TPA: GSU2403 family nucleotidyltransferase fold protein [Thermoanaerobaculia bacterium]